MNNKESIKKIKDIFTDGYIPRRGNEEYLSYSKNINCFGHACLNLTNRQINALREANPSLKIFDIAGLGNVDDDNYWEECLYAFIKMVGLEIKPIKTEKIKLAKNQWLIALYDAAIDSYHFARKEFDGSWTAKESFTSTISRFNKLPRRYINPNPNDPYENILNKLYVITNPYAEV